MNNTAIIKTKRIDALLLCTAIVIIMTTSFHYIIRHTSHLCTGEDCPICYEIQNCEHTLNTFFSTNFPNPIIILIPAIVLLIVRFKEKHQLSDTLVSLKVKLTD